MKLGSQVWRITLGVGAIAVIAAGAMLAGTLLAGNSAAGQSYNLEAAASTASDARTYTLYRGGTPYDQTNQPSTQTTASSTTTPLSTPGTTVTTTLTRRVPFAGWMGAVSATTRPEPVVPCLSANTRMPASAVMR